MNEFRREPPVIVAGRELTAVVRVNLMKHVQGGMWLFAGDKQPIAVICRSDDGEQIFNINGRRIDAAELERLMKERVE